MIKFKQLKEADEKKVVFSFGRFNPPTTGHEKLIKAADTIAKTQGADLMIFPSQSQDPKKNPLSFTDKVKFMRKIFRTYSKSIIGDKNIKTSFDVITKLYDMGYTDVTMVVGGDRVVEFDKLLNKYNGVQGRHGFYEFKNGIQIKSAGNRSDPDSDDAKDMSADAMSASLLRKIAADGDFELFSKGVPDTLGDTDKRVLFNKIRTGLKLIAINEMFELLFDEMLLSEEGEPITEKSPPDADIEKWLENPETKALFKDRYGDKWQEVMYATAWKMYNGKLKDQNEEWNIDSELDEDWTPADINELFVEEFKDYTKKSFEMLRERVKLSEEGEITQAHLNAIEKYADKLFAKVGIDVNFTRHFLDRVNDERNKKQITNAELVRLFKQTYAQYGKKISQLGPDAEAVLNDIKTDVNMPFILKWDDKNKELDMVAKTVMRKKDFKSPDQKFRVESAPAFKKIERGNSNAAIAMKAKAKYYKDEPTAEELEKDDDDPCWAGYVQVGMKKGKDGKEVPNCVPMKESKPKNLKSVREAYITEVTSNDLPQIGDIDGDGIDDDPYQDIQTRFVPYAIKVKGFPEFFLWSTSVSKVRSSIRMTLKRMDDIESIERVTDAEVRSIHRNRAYNPSELRAKSDDLSVRQDAYYRESLEFGSDELVKSYKKATPGELEEEAPQWIKNIIAKLPGQKDKYQKAAQALLRLQQDEDPKGRHSLDFWAVELMRWSDSTLDARTLVKYARKILATEAVFYAVENKQPLHSVYRPHSEMYYELFDVARELNVVSDGLDKYLLESTDIGEFARYDGEYVPLDIPLVENWINEEEEVELNSPKRGGAKKFYVYVKNDKGNVVKVSFGDTSGLQVKLDDPKARASFVARHDCDNKKDKTTPGYWSCRLPMYAKELGLEGGGDYFW